MTLPISRTWEVWAAANLLRGVPREKIAARLADEGLEASEIERLLTELSDSPVLEASRPFIADARRFQMVARLRAHRATPWARPYRRDHVDPREIPTLRFSGIPVVLSGLARSWPAMETWQPARLRARFGEVTLTTTVGRDAPGADYGTSFRRSSEKVTVAALVDWMLAGERSDFYVVALNRALDGELAALLDDVRLPEGWLDAPLRERAGLWMGPRGTVTTLHHDRTDILHCQLVGRKRWRLVDPTDRALLSQVRGVATALSPSQIEGARIFELDLLPGDVLYLPIGWWHEVTALDTAVSLSVALDAEGELELFRPGDA